MLKYIPNIITSMRIVGTAALLFCEPLSPVFYIIYTLCGLSDVLDGFIARMTNTTSEFGTKLDSVADMLYYAVMIFKIFPILIEVLPVYVWLTIAAAVLIRITSYITAAIKYRRFASLHTYLNKLTGAAVFSVPYYIKLSFSATLCLAVAFIAVLASLEELIIHIARREYNSDVKTLGQSKNVTKEA